MNEKDLETMEHKESNEKTARSEPEKVQNGQEPLVEPVTSEVAPVTPQAVQMTEAALLMAAHGMGDVYLRLQMDQELTIEVRQIVEHALVINGNGLAGSSRRFTRVAENDPRFYVETEIRDTFVDYFDGDIYPEVVDEIGFPGGPFGFK